MNLNLSFQLFNFKITLKLLNFNLFVVQVEVKYMIFSGKNYTTYYTHYAHDTIKKYILSEMKLKQQK